MVRLRRPPVVCRLMVLAFLLSGCRSTLGRGVALYEAGEYGAAARTFREADGEALSPAERARWQLYRGLTFMALGDRFGAIDALSACGSMPDAGDAVRLRLAKDSLRTLP